MSELAPRTRRLFVGIALDEEARLRCGAVSEELRKTGLPAKFEAVEKLHVTLAFLGNVASSRAEDIASALTPIATGLHPFAVTLDKLGAFPHERKPRVVYIGAREQGPTFRALAQRVRSAYTALGFPFEKDAVAHVTIARTKDPKRPLPLVEFAPIPLPIEHVALFESLFDKMQNTSRYEILATASL
ncbi:MAG: RNA 2',3'-cyclic phosphodiesterase [Candidatus Cybelea sp.]